MSRIPLNISIVHDRHRVKQLIDKALHNGVLTNNGPLVKDLEAALEKRASGAKCIVTSSGTSALDLALRSLNLQGEMITTPFSFIATTSSILWQHCTPIFADIDEKTLCINPEEIEKKVSPNTAGIVAVHIFGSICDVEAIEDIAKKHKIKTIYDAAHAFGLNYNNKSIFSYGDISTTSLHAFKIVNAAEGGAIFTRNSETFEKIFKLRYFGKDLEGNVLELGTNAKMSEFNAAMGLSSLENAEIEIARRKSIAQKYLAVLEKKKNIYIPKFLYNAGHNYSYFPIIFKEESLLDSFIALGNSLDIEIRRYFYPCLNEITIVNNQGDTPIAKDISKRIGCIPIYSTLKEEEIKRIIDLLNSGI